jgi:two-component system response regulator FixJ
MEAQGVEQRDASNSVSGQHNMPYLSIYNRDKRLHIVDADVSTCEFLCLHFRMEGFQVSFSLDADHLASTIARACPDILFIHLKVGDVSGIDILRQVRSLRHGTPVFMLADDGQFDDAVAAMKLGATDVFKKPFDSEHVSGAVRDALRRDIQYGSQHESGGRRVSVRGFSQLTTREREVLQLVADGKSNKEAGLIMGISPRTVEVHRARVMEKLGARNAADLIRIVLTS